MSEHLAVPCCGVETMEEPGTMAQLVWELCNGQRGNTGKEKRKYSEGLTVGLNQAIPGGGGGTLPIYTSWDSSCFCAMCLQLHQVQNCWAWLMFKPLW